MPLHFNFQSLLKMAGILCPASSFVRHIKFLRKLPGKQLLRVGQMWNLRLLNQNTIFNTWNMFWFLHSPGNTMHLGQKHSLFELPRRRSKSSILTFEQATERMFNVVMKNKRLLLISFDTASRVIASFKYSPSGSAHLGRLLQITGYATLSVSFRTFYGQWEEIGLGRECTLTIDA